MSHGVTENTAGLAYTGDAGGLNEATSDIFGTAVEFYANNASDVGRLPHRREDQHQRQRHPAALHGQAVPGRRAARTAGRPAPKNVDPHYSSGVGNHFFYLAREGSGAKTINGVSYNSPTCNSSTVPGIGRDAAEKIWYRALSTYMTSTETYPKARNSTIKAAIDLYGASSTQCAVVAATWSGAVRRCRFCGLLHARPRRARRRPTGTPTTTPPTGRTCCSTPASSPAR